MPVFVSVLLTFVAQVNIVKLFVWVIRQQLVPVWVFVEIWLKCCIFIVFFSPQSLYLQAYSTVNARLS